MKIIEINEFYGNIFCVFLFVNNKIKYINFNYNIIFRPI